MDNVKTALNIIEARGGGRVERCHGIPHHGSYNNAAHSWGVAMLMLQLWPDDFPRLAAACLTHDVPECWTGDIPAPSMRYVPGLKEAIGKIEDRLLARIDLASYNALEGEDYRKLKACDWLEFWLWCREQQAFGNRFAEEGRVEIERYMDTQRLPSPAQEVYAALKERSVVTAQAGVMQRVMEGQSGSL
jgi:hypothetical protein